MEEKKQLSVEVFNQILLLSKEDFLNFSQIVAQSDFKSRKIPFHSLNQCKTRALNIMIYYIISIQKNFSVFPSDNLGDRYRALCAKEISDYYIKNKFVIEEYQFSFLASKALNIRIEESAHIIYYLIYGRFASHPYINSLCSKETESTKKRNFKKDHSMGNIKKRTINRENTHEEIEVQNFRKDLKATLKPEKRCTLIGVNKFINKDKKLEQDQKILSVAATQRKPLNRGSTLNTFIPHRISQGENSLMFENLTYEKKFYQSYGDWGRKGLMRKQKFNEYFDISELKAKAKLKRNPFLLQENKENLNRNTFQVNNDSQQLNKINYQNFKRISTVLKNKSATLDKIRTQCTSRNHQFNFEKQSNETLQQTLQKLAQFENERSKQFRLMNKKIKRNSQDVQKIRSNKLNKCITNENNVVNFEKKQSNESQKRQDFLMPFQEDDEDQKQGEYAVNLLRNDNSYNQQFEDEGKKTELFAQTSLGFRKLDSKNKLQRYKADFRKFLKTQTLDRIKQAN